MPKINRLDGESRFYEIDGVGKFPSVTTILGIIAKPALVGWAKKMVALAIEPTLKAIKDGTIKPEDLDVEEILKSAKANPKSIMEEAGDIGTQIHKVLEILVNQKMKHEDQDWEGAKTFIEHTGVLEGKDDRIVRCVWAFIDWAKKVNFIPIESELMIYSRSIGYAGTLDAVGYVDNILSVVDFKSSKAYYPEMAMQLSAYRHAYAEMNKKKKVAGMLVLRLGKEDGEFEAIKVQNPAKNMIAFKSALNLWKWKQNTEKKEK